MLKNKGKKNYLTCFLGLGRYSFQVLPTPLVNAATSMPKAFLTA